MKSVNSVHLEGIVESCRVIGEVMGKTAAKLSVITLHPKEQSVGADISMQEYEKIRHNVRVVADGPHVDLLRSLESELKTERATGLKELMTMHPCIVEGVLREQNGENFVEARDGGFSLSDTLKTKGNNLAKIVGKVLAVTYTDRSCRLELETPQGKVQSFFPRQINRNSWDAVASGKIAKGDLLSLQGPLMNMEFSDGTQTISTSMVVPHVIQKIRLRKAQSNVVSI